MRSVFIFLLFGNFIGAQNFAQWVNPFIGTGEHGHTFPGATAPFGMVQLSPDTRIDGSWDGCSGYHYSDSIIYGFSHTHLSGTGVTDYGDIMLMPTFGVEAYRPENYGSTFSHSNEKAQAGYYSVYLDKYKTQVELTTGPYVGFHKYTFQQNGKVNILLDLNHRDELLEGEIIQIDAQHYGVLRRSKAWAENQYVYAYIEFDKPVEFSIVESNGEWKNNTINATELKATFSKNVSANEVLQVKVSLSFTGYEGALLNSKTVDHWNFEKLKSHTVELWNTQLSKIEIFTDNTEDKTIFYTSLYHTMIQPNLAQDTNGRYRGRDNQLHYTDRFTYYTVFSLWDTFRATHPLYNLIETQRNIDFINTFLKEFEQGGRLPVWELASNETDCMIGYHSVSVIADAMIKNLKGFDYELAYIAARHSADLDRSGLAFYKKNHFISSDEYHESVSKTLEYAYDDWCIAQMARKLKKEEDYKYYDLRSQNWKNVFDSSLGFMRARYNGGWYSPFDPREVNNNYTEGNSWQYSFFVPQDINGMIEAYGGNEKFEKKLDELFSAPTQTTGRTQVDITGLIGQYAHGNEPSHHIAYLYNFVNKPEKTEEKVHYILQEFYKNAPDGIIGNEDCGQMSAWYILSSLGLYSVTPGIGDIWTGTRPYFPKAIIHKEDGTSIVITQENYKDKYIIPHKYLKLDSIVTHRIESEGFKNERLIPTPIIHAPSKTFKNSMQVHLTSNSLQSANLYYSTDQIQYQKYTQPFSINETTKVYAYSDEMGSVSDTIFAHYFKKPNNFTVELHSQFNPQYNAGGSEGLVDGVYGDTDWRKGDWQGYQSQDFEAVIDLQNLEKIQSLNSHYLQDSRSWILMPTKVLYYVSKDGKNFTQVGEVINTVDPKNNELIVKDFPLRIKKQKVKYVKIIAQNYGALPEWHQGFGGDAFIFIDEINIK